METIITASADSKSNSTSCPDTPRASGELARPLYPPAQSVDVSPGPGTLPDTEFMLAAIRSATLRARLCANELDAVGIALKSSRISVGGAIAWLRDENLLDHVLFRPELLNGSNTA